MATIATLARMALVAARIVAALATILAAAARFLEAVARAVAGAEGLLRRKRARAPRAESGSRRSRRGARAAGLPPSASLAPARKLDAARAVAIGLGLAAGTAMAVALVASGTGCAGIVHRPLPIASGVGETRDGAGAAASDGPGVWASEVHADDDADLASTGIRYYGGSLYLLVWSDGQGGVLSRIVEMPDPTKPMVAEPYAILSRIDATIEFRDGVLARARGAPDTTALPTAVIRAAEGIVRAAAAAIRRESGGVGAGAGDDGGGGTATGTGGVAAFPAPHVYKIRVTGGGIEFIGGPGDLTVRVGLIPDRRGGGGAR